MGGTGGRGKIRKEGGEDEKLGEEEGAVGFLIVGSNVFTVVWIVGR